MKQLRKGMVWANAASTMCALTSGARPVELVKLAEYEAERAV